jgi:ferredoxin-NADP reductase
MASENRQFTYKDFISGEQRISQKELMLDDNTEFYICGPDALKNQMISDLKSLHISKSKIHIEHFADGYVSWFGLFK